MENLIGKKLEEFEVPAYANEDFTTVTDKDLEGKWSILFFYPGDFTFVCPTELQDLQKHYEKLKSLGVEVYSVSTDSEFVHKAWKDESVAVKGVQYPMLSDRAFVLSRMLGVLKEKDGQSLRGSFVINPENEIVAYEIHSDGIGRDASELVRKVEAAQFVATYGDKVCPAAWHPGDDTLTPGKDLVGKI
ncbi:redoxin domain-containing protein [Helcococcus ovis]|uniref:redoxin domain-containing protein n=1 Tax=Helcococcus ovis TaxID=72026 RepID=UPI0038BAA9A6